MELAKHLIPQENIKGNCEVGLQSERWWKTIEVTVSKTGGLEEGVGWAYDQDDGGRGRG